MPAERVVTRDELEAGTSTVRVTLVPYCVAIIKKFGSIFSLGDLWIAVASVSLLDAVWSCTIGVALSGYLPIIMFTSVLFISMAAFRLRRQYAPLAAATEVVALWLAFAYSGNLLSYLSATPALPLQDDALASADSLLGFQWPVMFHWVIQHLGFFTCCQFVTAA